MKKSLAFIMVLTLALGFMLSCSDNPAEAPSDDLAKLTCVECHTDQAKLMALATPEPPSEGEAGEG